MPSQIRPTRLEVSDRFPMLGFTVKTDGDNKSYEVAVATDPALFRVDAKPKRTRATFYSSRAEGMLPVARGEAVYVVRPEVLARFAGQERLYFALVTYANGKGKPELTMVPSADSAYVSLKGLTGRSLQRVRLVPTRQRGVGYQNGSTADLEWGGDIDQPGTQTVAAPANGKTAAPATPAPAATASAFEYNDGFGPLPPPPGSRPANGIAKNEDLLTLAARLGVEADVRALLQKGASEQDIRAILEKMRGTQSVKEAAAQALEADEPPSEDTVALLDSLAQQPAAAATALVFDADDVEAAKKYAPKWVDLIRYKVPDSIASAVMARGMSIQTIEDAIGDLNLDFYPVRVSSLPTIDGSVADGAAFLRYIRLHINDFVDTRNSDFAPYDDATDKATWESTAPDGSVIYINIAGPQDAAVVTNQANDRHWRFATVHTPRSGEHPVSGHREFGFFKDGDDYVFYTKGADRSTGALATAGDFITFTGADLLWKSFQNKLVDFVNANGGSAAKVARFSQRFKWSVVNIILSPQGSSLALGQTARLRRALSQGLAVTPIPVDQAKPVKLPAARPATTAERIAIEAAVAVFSGPMFPIITGLRALTDQYNISVAIGPSAGVGFVLGLGVGVGIIFSPGGKIGVYGKFEASGGILDSIFGGQQLTIVRGGIDEFNEVAFAVGGAFVEGVAVNLQVLLSPEHGFRGISFLLGVGISAEPLELFLAIEGALAGEVAATQAAALAEQSFSINWDDVGLIPQPNDVTCWATAAAMAIGWRDQFSLTPETVAKIAGRTTATGLNQNERRKFATEIGLVAEEPACYTIDGFRNLLEQYGPLWVSVQIGNSGHAILVTGMYSDGAPDGSDTFVRISDPWDRVVGAPGAPGAYLNTHNTGSRYIMSWADFTKEYEDRASAAPDGTVNAQILHATDNGGREPSRAGAVGYAMAAAASRKPAQLPAPPRPVRRAGTLGAGVEIASAVAGAVMERIIAGEGSITWELDQLRGLKHPNDVAPSPLPAFRDAATIRLDQWPYLEALDSDQISAWFSVDWQFNGTSLGNVRITNVGTNGALLQKLHVSARITDDNIVYPQNAPAFAALRVRLHYRFSRSVGSDSIAIQDLHLFGDGTFESSGHWEQ